MASNNFERILDQLRADPYTLEQPIYAALSRFLTYDGRLPLEHGLDALNDLERRLFERAEGSAARLTRQPAADPGEESICVFYNDLGRLHLRRTIDPPPRYPSHVELLPLGYFAVPRALCDELERAIQPELAEERRLRALIDERLCAAERDGSLERILAVAEDAVRHVEAVCVYVDDELWSVMERCTTLIDTRKFGSGLLSGLRAAPLASWTPTQRLGVAALYALYQSGRSIRFEEFNGKQLTARRLFARLRALGSRYVAPGQPPGLPGDADLFALAEAVGRGAQDSIGRPWLRYRWINGLTYVKIERIADTPPDSAADAAIPDSIAALYEAWIGRPLDRRRGHAAIFAELADCALAGSAPAHPPGTPARIPLELLIQSIVAAAVLAARADYGMSSSLRNPSALLAADDATLLSGMLALQPRDFFTCLVARPGLSALMGERIKQDVYAGVQARMQYNRWHFIAGNFARADIPQSRHHFYPPTLPDIAEWSDQQHGGHTQGGVRYSIRAPGPDMNQPPLMIGGRPYRGFYDVRVVRMEGPPFTLPDMLLVRHHSLWMGVVWRRLVAYCERSPGALAITGFEKGDGYEIPEEMA